MNRVKIEQALIEIIEQENLQSIISPTLSKETLIGELPALWFSPLKLTEIQGRYSGREEYYLEMALIYDCSSQSNEAKIVTADEMERKLLSIITSLSLCRGVAAIYDTTIEVVEKNLSRVGNLTLYACCNITSYF